MGRSTRRSEKTRNLVILSGVTLFLGVTCPRYVAADLTMDGGGYGPVVAAARVVDRQGRPVPDVQVRFRADLDGVVIDRTDQPQSTRWATWRTGLTAVSGGDGIARAFVPAPGGLTPRDRPWFRGTVRLRATAEPGPGQDAAAADPDAAADDADATATGVLAVPAGLSAPGDDIPTLHLWEAPDRRVEGFPLWLGRDGRVDRVVVLVEGFDLYNRYSATDGLRLIGAAGDALRAAGLDILVVDFPDSHLAPDALAPRVAQAIRAASRAAGDRPVAVAGLSAGGLAARWALVSAEASGRPLPVHTLLFLDTPHRGANLNPALQALVLRYGKRGDREALGSAAAHALLAEAITDAASQVRWRRIGFGPASRFVPRECRPTTAAHDAFYARLSALNDRNGYPTRCRLVAVANSSRVCSRFGTAPGPLLRMWLPWGSGWTLAAGAADRAAGSLLPRLYADQFAIRYPLGLAGASLRIPPTFLPAASALDAAPGESPPFDAWYARPDGMPPLAHDHVDVDPGAAAFTVRELLRPGAWDAGTPQTR